MSLKLIKHTTWSDVLSIWRDNEAHLEHWTKYYKNKGFESWEDWRKHDFIRYGCNSLKWSLFEVVDPAKTILSFRGGSSRTWTKRYYNGKSHPTFKEIASHPDISSNEGIKSFIKNFPEESILIGVKTGKGIVIIEGMHRCAAMALANKEKKKIKAKIKIALGA
jgi:hypothetical protein